MICALVETLFHFRFTDVTAEQSWLKSTSNKRLKKSEKSEGKIQIV